MFLGLPRVVPLHLNESLTIIADLERPHDHPRDSLECVQPWSGPQQLFKIVPFEDSPHRRGVVVSPVVTKAGENLPRVFGTHGFDQISAKTRHGVHVVEYDSAALKTELALTEGDELIKTEVFSFHGWLPSIRNSCPFIMKHKASRDHPFLL